MIEKEGIFVHSHFCFQIIISFICNYVKRWTSYMSKSHLYHRQQ
jgi:hypothetical protein